ncbi:MAG: hydantoinase B/oxoprolinase family protein, partial [Pseudomonadota bacterium]
AAARGHHADVGGLTPGSMPAFSRTIDDEGAIFRGLRIVGSGHFDEDVVRQTLIEGAYPARNAPENIGDLKAQIAACQSGARDLEKAVTDFGRSTVLAYMAHVRDNAEASVRRVIDRLKDGEATVRADAGWQVQVRVTIDQTARRAKVDFTGSSPQQPTNVNAPAAIAKAAVLYVFRCLVDADIPMNEGCLAPLEIVLPPGSVVNPDPPAAVVAGNVETSQMIADALLGACGALSGSQGTMNNLTFGTEGKQYYETICGGAGAGPGVKGASAVHTHMTNSRLTDPEILEQRYPVRLRRFTIRKGSGGTGAWRGGDGAIRELTFLQPATVSLLTGHRLVPPLGLAGGGPGACGENAVERADGTVEPAPAITQLDLNPGDTLILKTPGGAGFGTAQDLQADDTGTGSGKTQAEEGNDP